ncbi:hypothetical protein PSACC_02996 [Paramicrosporidium saccamoebae]|uniref:Metalloenzyme domain-containing protein n=1 Tax=Paramicrosporidium saccamoebae TaxID=1246581 RepID=A0A2H9THK8_9FUNG|nr:hypothetical protein PSACC_02996 [Paramicrosporidium saccamoebae]
MGNGYLQLQCVFSCWNEETGIVTKRRPERDFVEQAKMFCQCLSSVNLIPSFPQHRAEIHYAKEHRCVIKIIGPSLSDEISGTDPTKDPMPIVICVPSSNSDDAILTCQIVNELHMSIWRILKAHPVNIDRQKRGEPPVNVCLLRGCSMAINVPSFEAQHGLKALLIAPTPIIAGIGKTVGLSLLKAPGATGTLDTDMFSKAKVAMDALFTNSFDMAVIHIKCVDDCGHDGDAEGKINALQRVDDMVKWILNYPEIESGEHIIAVTGDHSTPINVSDHTSEPVPFVVSLTKGSLKGHPTLFDEVSCSSGVLGRFVGSSVMTILKNLRTNYQALQNPQPD